MEEKNCKVLGYKAYDEKDNEKKLTGKKMLRVIITIESNEENGYIGRIPVAVYFEYDQNLCIQLSKVINSEETIKYETSENILTGKTKVSKLIF